MKGLIPKFHPSLWSDRDIEALAPIEKLAFIWGWTNTQITNCGFCQYSTKRFQFETGLDFAVMLAVCNKLPRTVMHFPDVEILYFRKFIRHQYGSGPSLKSNNVFKSILGTFNSVLYKPLRNAIAQDCPELGGVIEPNGEVHQEVTQSQIAELLKKASEEEVGFRVRQPKPSIADRVKLLYKAKAMTEEEVTDEALRLGLPPSDGEWFWSKCEGNGWTNNGKPIKDWKQTFRSWALAGYLPSKKNPVKMVDDDKTGTLPLL